MGRISQRSKKRAEKEFDIYFKHENKVMEKVFVINFDEAIIFEVNRGGKYYNEEYETFEEAKEQLISYWDNILNNARFKLKEIKNSNKPIAN